MEGGYLKDNFDLDYFKVNSSHYQKKKKRL